jgi:c-di-GMP-binding flagellar brake protein YcgR
MVAFGLAGSRLVYENTNLMTNDDGINRRVNTRVLQKGYIRVVVESSPEAPTLEGKAFRCTTRDLSAGGLQMVVHSNVPIGTRVKVYVVFETPHAEFEHIARVAWAKTLEDDIVQSYAIGIEFRSTNTKADRTWEDLLQAKMLGAKPPPPGA